MKEEQKFDGDFVVGDEYETREGGRVTYLGHNPYAPNDKYYQHCWISHANYFTTEKGGNYSNAEHYLDIIRHIKPKEKVVGYVNVYNDNSVGQLFETRKDADFVAYHAVRVACIRVEFEYEEGQFDD